MKQTSIDKEILHVDYSREGIPESAKNFMPSVYRDGEVYHCILGTDKDTGIFGSGKSVDEAISEWDKSYQEKKHK
ncbi:hypothetical protein SAMN05428949_0330 [Chitinophaga sp. YR627]|uniref:hypothetical protein n=1 Tax=Chitinophaga sp. YR627 TaxID=1881041 RepID=UPI0008E1D45E|nr:hypothetical protein [Chitinophaga sp. YR627]SFM65704.1 hypothetical protein SAMN05428949_0330 [Chitinophaga sp. YR627]